MEQEILTDDAATLERVAEMLDNVPGADGLGLSPQARADLFSFLEGPSPEGWVAIRNCHITRTHTLRVAVMRHRGLGMYAIPSYLDVVVTLGAAHRGEISC